jgi:hypothetical protein
MADGNATIGNAGEDSSPVTVLKAGARPAASQKEIEKEIEAGLPNQVGRMRDAYDCLRYRMARFEEYPTRHKDMRYRSPSVRRTTRIFGRIADVLTMHLYKSQPTRKLGDEVVSEWLEKVYRRNYLAQKLRRTDLLTLTGGFAALQFAGSKDPHCPLDINLWGAEQLAFWVAPSDPTKVDAVATVDFQDNRRRLELWTRDQVVSYETTKGMIHPGFGSTTFRLASRDGKPARRPNPYRDRDGQGIIPFEFAHWEFPSTDFETNSPGPNLKELNQGVNERLDNLGDSIYFNCKPIGTAENVDDGWTPPAELRPGDFIKLPASSIDAGGNGPRPTLSYLMPDLAYVTKDWEDQNAFLDHTLEMWGVPPALIRMIQTGARSGAAIQSEQLPILGWVEGRRTDWACYEERFAEKAIAVAASHLANAGLDQDAYRLLASLEDWKFSLRWPSLHIQLPGPERDTADDWRLGHSQVSLIGIKQEREGLTEAEAIEALRKVAEQNRQLQAMGIDPNPGNPFASQKSLGGPGPDGQPGLPSPSDGPPGQPALEDLREAQGPEMGLETGKGFQEDRLDWGGG